MIIEYIKENLALADLSQCQRLFHGRGHAYPDLTHVNIDWFEPVVVITLYQPVERLWLMDLAHWLADNITASQSIQVQYRDQAQAPIEVLLGESIARTQVNERGEKYHIQLGQSQNLGIFLDMANGRQWLKANASDKSILNLFAYTCAFSVAAIAGGAKQVVNIDMAKAALSRGRENHQLNQHELSKVKFDGVDIFKSYNRLKKHGPYDIVVCDPPSFQKGSVNIERDYKKIIKRLPQLLVPQGQALLCLNSPDLDEEFLKNEVARECPQCHFVKRINNPEVFKEAFTGKGLKVLLFRYQPN